VKQNPAPPEILDTKDETEISMAPIVWAASISNKVAPGSFSNVTPFENPATLKERLDEPVCGVHATYKKVVKAIAANNNSHTNLGFFAASLVCYLSQR
jgi:hypothetical protein